MGTGDRLFGITSEELQEYIDSEAREAEIERESDELENSDFDDEIIEDEPITISEILNSPSLKLELCQYIGASNWTRWKQLKSAQDAWDEVGV